MSLNKAQLIGNVGKDPDVRYLDSGVAVATFPLATTDRAYTLPMVHKFPNGQNGTISYCGAALPKLRRNMYTKVINCILKERYVPVRTMTRME